MVLDRIYVGRTRQNLSISYTNRLGKPLVVYPIHPPYVAHLALNLAHDRSPVNA